MTIDELEKLAKAATQGKWYVSDKVFAVKDDTFLVIASPERWIAHVLEGTPLGEEDAAFIAAANPKVVLELIATTRQLQAERDAAHARGWNEAVEAAAKIAKNAWLVSTHGTIGDADYGNAICEQAANDIRALKKETTHGLQD